MGTAVMASIQHTIDTRCCAVEDGGTGCQHAAARAQKNLLGVRFRTRELFRQVAILRGQKIHGELAGPADQPGGNGIAVDTDENLRRLGADRRESRCRHAMAMAFATRRDDGHWLRNQPERCPEKISQGNKARVGAARRR